MQRHFWSGVAVGAVGASVALLAGGFSTSRGRMLRVERSVKVNLPTADVFAACARLELMPQLIRGVVSVAASEDVSLWIADLEGHRYAWDLEIVQVIPNQVIGWKSHQGPKHSGRINFFSVGSETLVQVDMNCAPRSLLSRFIEGRADWSLGDAIEAALHDLKASLEKPRIPEMTNELTFATRAIRQAVAERFTGTYGPSRGAIQECRTFKGEQYFDDDYDH